MNKKAQNIAIILGAAAVTGGIIWAVHNKNKSGVRSVTSKLYFKPSEFDSPDQPGSGKKMDHTFLIMLNNARHFAGIPFIVESGFRTKAYTLDLKRRGYQAVLNSSHEYGKAVDIRYTPATFKTIINAMVKAGFRRIGIGKDFIHVDIDTTKTSPAVWTYNSTPLAMKAKEAELENRLIKLAA